MYPDHIIKRFQKKYIRGPEEQCWEWLGRKNSNGYGVFSIGDEKFGAHRIAYEIAYGEIPPGMEVCHNCDNPGCVNPSCFFLGTHKQNMDDRDAKCRQAFGARHGSARLTEETVALARRERAEGAKIRELAEKYGVEGSVMFHALRGNTWRHVAVPVATPSAQSHFAKLDEVKVRALRADRATGMKQKELAEKYGITEDNVSLIVLRKSWKHVE